MRTLGKYWRLLLAVLLLAAAAAVYFLLYIPTRTEYDAQTGLLRTQLTSAQANLMQSERYAEISRKIPAAEEDLRQSRSELYGKFPVEMKEEDQILYMLDLEQRFENEIHFDFATPEPITVLSDGAVLEGLLLKINYSTTYQGFKDMVNYLSTDERITSVRYAVMNYDAVTDTLEGTVTIQRYLMVRMDGEYQEPSVQLAEDVGKQNIFG